MYATESIDRLFLELSQFTSATTQKERDLLLALDVSMDERVLMCALMVRMARRFGFVAGRTETEAEGEGDKASRIHTLFIDLPSGRVSWTVDSSRFSVIADIPVYHVPEIEPEISEMENRRRCEQFLQNLA